MKKFRPTAVPLITVDPFFSIWSCADKLTDDAPRHWSGYRNAMTGLVFADGKCYCFMGKVQSDNRMYMNEPEVLPQKCVTVMPTRTVYCFENNEIELIVEFMSPLLTDDLMLMSCPVSYITYKINSKDGKKRDFKVYMDIGMESCVKNTWDIVEYGAKNEYAYCGKGTRDILCESGDMIPIEWGNLYLSSDGAEHFAITTTARNLMAWGAEYTQMNGSITKVCDDFPALACVKNFAETTEANGVVCVAYDDIYSVEYMGEHIKAYWKKSGDTILDVIKKAKEEYHNIRKKCEDFDNRLMGEARKISEEYSQLVSLAYRQIIAAHKLVEIDGKLMYFSKECGSNGCMGTVDITYPSIPMFLKYNPKLAEGMLNPIFDYVERKLWNYDFAPHDVGEYPLANGQVYGLDKKTRVISDNMQMPVEECGNMILCVAGICKAEKSIAYAKANKDVLGKWADYLADVGYDPANQLCTDDFAGHLAHNCNLSIKAILAIAAWGRLLDEMGENGEEYISKATEYARKWEKAAFDGNHYKLAFDKDGTWSLKYNLVWDKYLNLNVFDKKVFATETEFYKKKFNEYGLPLDSRASYTKSDWQMWVTCLSDDKEFRKNIVDKMWGLVCDMPDRVPFTDWYETEKPRQKSFQARSVQGGLFLPLLNM